MYRFEGKLVPGGDHKEALRAFALEGYAATTPLAVPPEPSALDWIVKAAQQKLDVMRKALESQVGGNLQVGCHFANYKLYDRSCCVQDLKTLANAMLPVLLVCLVGVALLAANLTRKSKRE